MNDRLDSNFLEKLIIKGMLIDKRFLAIVSSVYKPEYFDNSSASSVFEFTSNYLEEYNTIPEEQAIVNSMKDNDRQEIRDFFSDVNAVDFDMTKSYDYLFDQTNKYLKEQAIKKAIMESVDIIDKKSDTESIREKIEEALSKDLKIDLGLKYFEDLGERLRRIFSASDIRVPTYFPVLDEFIAGGFPPFTLSLLVARIHGFKSNMLANIAARQVLHGKNVVLMTLEMAQDAFAQRFDSILSLMDINRMYLEGGNRGKLFKSLKNIRDTENRGELFIKQFPTGDASVRDFKTYLRELQIRGIKPDILMADYINLMKAASKTGEGMYSSIKRISEELRSLSFEFEVPVVSVSQLNREGTFVGFQELDYNYIAECLEPSSKVNKKDGSIVALNTIKVGDRIKGSKGFVTIKRVFPHKKKISYKIKTKSGKEIICSGDHEFPTNEGIKSIKNGLKIGNFLKSRNFCINKDKVGGHRRIFIDGKNNIKKDE